MASLLDIPPVPKTSREEFQRAAWRFISRKDGPKRLAAALVKQAKQFEEPVLVDGIRQRATLEQLRKFAAPMTVAVLFVHTPPHIAFQFYADRTGRKMQIHEFLQLCDAPVETDVKKLISLADAVLYNWNGKLKYEQAVRKLMRELRG